VLASAIAIYSIWNTTGTTQLVGAIHNSGVSRGSDGG
jgi:hypothetical protein